MIRAIQRSLEVKIAVALVCVLGLIVGAFTAIDIRTMRADMIRASEQSLRSLAGLVKGNVDASMRHGYHEDVRRIIEEARASFGIDRIVMYDGSGKPVRSSGTGPDALQISASLLQSVMQGDLTDIEHDGKYYLSYYSSIPNQKPCFRCHGEQNALNGVLRIDFPLHGVESLIEARKNSILAWTVIMIVSLLFSLAVLMQVLVHRPVEELRRAMAQAEAGGTGAPAPRVTGADEFSELKRGFYAMLERINALHRTNLEKEKELARNQEVMRFRSELQTMFEAMPDGVLLVDRNMRIVQSNPRVYDLLPGIEQAGGVIRPDTGRKECSPFGCIEDVLRQGKVITTQCSLSLPGGEARYLHGICAPILENGKPEYAVAVIRDISDRVRTEFELEEKTAELVAANKLLSRIAITDSLTQVYNRRYFDETLYKEVKRFNRSKYAHLSLMMIDIDHFKQLNDTYGHLTGDTILREVATVIRKSVRETDTVARYGGEEFAIIMPDTHADGAAFRAEALRKKIEERVFAAQGRTIRATITIGVAAYAGGTPLDIVRAADQALYQAKNEGRNRVIAAP